ncbi:MAG: N-acetylmuramoyl-L-alanine amidase [Cytophagales bacterium]|nr:MAG: N-acetylmuramoyl-L-alanine amidase [Cytophagales bacterium]
MKKSIAYLFLILSITASTFSPEYQYKVKTLVIDAGHGGKDPGCVGHLSDEAEITLKVALELEQVLKENMPNVKVILTRNDDQFVELIDRASIANKNNADLFISIHCNSGPEHVYGSETYTMGAHKTNENLEVAKRENSVILKETNYKKKYNGYDPKSPQGHILFALYQNANMENSLRFAEKVEQQFSSRVGRTSRGVKQAGFLVLWKTAMPSALIEIGYLSNKNEEKFLNQELNRTYIASGIYRAFKDYKEEIESR